MRIPTACSATLLAAALVVVGAPAGSAVAYDDSRSVIAGTRAGKQDVRFATYNASLNRAAPGDLVRDLSTPANTQARAIAEVIQINRPDVVLLNEFDYVAGGRAADLFSQNYLRVGQNGKAPIDYPYVYTVPSNTGVPSGFDLNNDGRVGGADDALGFGAFEGQYGMVVYSRYPIRTEAVRTFQDFLWKDMPGALSPDNPATEAADDWYSTDELAAAPAVQQVALGRPRRGRRQDRARPRQPSDATGVRRAGGSERQAQQRRDPLLVRLRDRRSRRVLHLRRRRRYRRPEPRRAVRRHG